jgi:NAD(P)-dependent dehydrogenase (short-subunit alcohol dehydrogenase family)
MTRAKSVFITGAGSGIGRAMALHFASKGWLVGVADISEEGRRETLSTLPPDRGFETAIDVRDRRQWDEALSRFAERARGIDVVCNNAGIAFGGTLEDHSEDEVRSQIDINFTGVVHGARAAYPFLRQSAPGSCLLNTASASALYGVAGMAVYSATKFAVRGLTEALEIEWHADGIKVRSIMPGFIDTPLLSGPANSKTGLSKREGVVATGLGFTPIERVAEAAWNAVHGDRVHTLAGPTARQMALAARFAPGYVRQRSRKLRLLDPGSD